MLFRSSEPIKHKTPTTIKNILSCFKNIYQDVDCSALFVIAIVFKSISYKSDLFGNCKYILSIISCFDSLFYYIFIIILLMLY